MKLDTGHNARQSLKQEPRVGLLLGVGGAWLARTLQAIALETARDPRRADYIIGTSAEKRIWGGGFAGFTGFRDGSGSPSSFPDALRFSAVAERSLR